ncbi:hypothetical protein IR010_17815 [Flavobacterium sp. MR2016-29]|uniref:hypothetical protein n=1 Tax=Flavobacterium sp. MR2016-29 TaxID=2783795 RepID=UPI001889F4E9|nr:hypothetical protein [Flavobacterium sp. MR2016-29]MBF4494407.1 hypothetical protein [Flavobacterium sp. MR2016-29]
MHKCINYSICFLFTLFLFACNEESINNQENISTVNNNLKLSKFSNSNIAENITVDFENVNEFEKDNFKIVENAAREKNANFLQSDLLQNQLKYQVITIEYANKPYSYLLEIYAHKKSTVYPMTITKLKDFSGALNVYSFDGENLGSIGVSKGIAKNISEKEDLNILTTAINLFSDNSNLTNRIPPCNTPYYLPMQFTVDYYNQTSFDGTVISYDYMYSTTTTVQVLMTYPCDALPSEVGHAYTSAIINDHGAGGAGTSEFENLRIYNNLTGKARCLNTLLNNSGNSFVKKMLEKFEGSSEFSIKISSVDKVYSDAAKTIEINGTTKYDDSDNTKNMDIEISSTRIDAVASLEAARIILHEYIHADMYRKLYTKDKTAIDVQDFKKVFDLYEKNYHSSMAVLYVNSMRDALKEFHKNVLTDDYNKYVANYGTAPSDDFYEAMAWGGLRNGNVKAWTDLPADKKASIESLASGVTQLTKTYTCPN